MPVGRSTNNDILTPPISSGISSEIRPLIRYRHAEKRQSDSDFYPGTDCTDEGVWAGRTFEIVGSNQVVVYDNRQAAQAGKEFKFLYQGDKYDLASRERLGPPRTDPDPPVVARAEPAEDGDDPEPQPPIACESSE